MTSTLRMLRTFAMAAAIALYATAASPQSAGDVWLATVFEPQVHDHEGHADAVPSQGDAAGMPGMPRDVMARIAALDERIKTLATDMHMFVGELKVETMAALLTAIVERQSVMRDKMRRMHDSMMRRMMEDPPAASLADEPGTMCSPSP